MPDKVRISLEETDAKVMRPGLSARVEVVRRKFENALVVPREAVTRGPKGYSARRPGGSAPLDVRVAACLPRECVIEQGLAEGKRSAERPEHEPGHDDQQHHRRLSARDGDADPERLGHGARAARALETGDE